MILQTSQMADEQGNYGYEMELITYQGSGIETVEGLKGRTLAFTSPTSNSGFKAPSALLKSEFKLEADKDFKTAFSGKHDNSIMGVANRDYDAAAVANSVLHQMEARGVVKPEQFKVLYTSQTFPTTAYGYVYNLKPELAQKVREGFETFNWKGSPLEQEFKNSGQAQFIPITYKQHWDVVRKIDQAMDVSYQCEK